MQLSAECTVQIHKTSEAKLLIQNRRFTFTMVGLNSQSAFHNDLCEHILQCVRSSNLHFTTQETPFSLYITVRKKLINGEKCSEAALGESGKLREGINEKLENLAKIKVDLENELQKVNDEKKSLESDVHDLSIKLEKAKGEIQEGIVKHKIVVDKNDEITHENKKVSKDLTRCKTENEDFR